jgi:hypothetical protein
MLGPKQELQSQDFFESVRAVLTSCPFRLTDRSADFPGKLFATYYFADVSFTCRINHKTDRNGLFEPSKTIDFGYLHEGLERVPTNHWSRLEIGCLPEHAVAKANEEDWEPEQSHG